MSNAAAMDAILSASQVLMLQPRTPALTRALGFLQQAWEALAVVSADSMRIPRDREGGATLLIALTDQVIGGVANLVGRFDATTVHRRISLEIDTSDPVGLQDAMDETSQDLKQLGAMSIDRRVQHAERMAMKWGGLYEEIVMMTSSSHGPMRLGNPRDHVELRRMIKSTARHVATNCTPDELATARDWDHKLADAKQLADAVLLYLGGPADE